MKTRQIIIWASFAVFMLTSIVIAGTVGLIDVGLDKPTEDKVIEIIAEKRITEGDFIKESVEVNVQQYEKEKIMQIRKELMTEFMNCQKGSLVYIQECLTALQTVNNAHKVVTEPVEEPITP